MAAATSRSLTFWSLDILRSRANASCALHARVAMMMPIAWSITAREARAAFEMGNQPGLAQALQHAAKQQCRRVDELLGNPLHCVGEQVALVRVEVQDSHLPGRQLRAGRQGRHGPRPPAPPAGNRPTAPGPRGEILHDYRSPGSQGFQARTVIPLVLGFVHRRGIEPEKTTVLNFPFAVTLRVTSWLPARARIMRLSSFAEACGVVVRCDA